MNFYNGSYAGGSYLPPSPIGNVAMAQQGSLPYSPVGGYYYNNYNSYFNPWELQRRQDEMIQQHNQAVNTQIEICKAIIQNANQRFGIEVSDSDLNKQFESMRPNYTNSSEYYQQQREQEKESRLYQAISSPAIGSMKAEARMQAFVKEEEKYMKEYEGLSLAEQYQKLNEIMFDQRQEQARKESKNMKSGYNPGDYRSLISRSSNNQYSRTTNNVDDLEIVMPNTLCDDYQDRRVKFMQQILSR